MVLECVEGLGDGLGGEFGFSVESACVCASVGGSRCTCGMLVCGGVGVRECVHVCCVVWLLR